MIHEAKTRAENVKKFEPTYRVDVLDDEGKIVARVDKTRYVRRKRH